MLLIRITLMNTMIHKSFGRFRSKNQELQGLFRHLNGKDINREYASMSTLRAKCGNLCFNLSAQMYHIRSLLFCIYNWPYRSSAADTELLLPLWRKHVKFHCPALRNSYLYFILRSRCKRSFQTKIVEQTSAFRVRETQLIPQYERCMSLACRQFLLFEATSCRTPKNKSELT